MTEASLAYIKDFSASNTAKQSLPVFNISAQQLEDTLDQMVLYRQRVLNNQAAPAILAALDTIRRGDALSPKTALALAEEYIWELIALAWIINSEFGPHNSGAHMCTGSYGLSGGCPQGCNMCSFSSRQQEDMLITQPEFQRTPAQFVAEAQRQVKLARQHNPNAKVAFKVTHIGMGLKNMHGLLERYVEILKAVRTVDGIDYVDACLGLLDERSAAAIAPYVDKYNNNLERIQREGEVWVTDKHSLQDKIETLRLARNAGMNVCSGVLFGGGESMQDKVDILQVLRELVDEGVVGSSPLNAFVPIYPSDIETIKQVPEQDMIIGLCLARIMLPTHSFFPNAGRDRYHQYLPAMHAIANGYSSHNNYLTKFVDPDADRRILEALELRTVSED